MAPVPGQRRAHIHKSDTSTSPRCRPRYADGPTARFLAHRFDLRGRENGIEHRFARFNHPWTNGQVERMNRTINEATVQRCRYDDGDQLSKLTLDEARAAARP